MIERVFPDTEDDVLQHTVTVNSGYPHGIRYQPTSDPAAVAPVTAGINSAPRIHAAQ
ncbi:hypothetical protein RKD46_000086 [Streptomyces pseudovenezuelae]